MRLHRLHADGEGRRHVLVAFAFGKKLHHLAFAHGQPAGRDFRGRDAPLQVTLEDDAGNAGTEIGLMLAERLERRDEMRRRFALEHATAGAGREDLMDQRLVFRAGEGEHFGARKNPPDLPGDFDPVELRHTDVEDHDVRLLFGGQFDRLAPILGFPADFPAPFGFDQGTQAAPHDFVIVDDENPSFFHGITGG